MQGQQQKAQKIIARANGWDPDAVVNPSDGTSVPLADTLAMPAAVFTNQGVPMTYRKFPDQPDGYDVSKGLSPDDEDFKFGDPSREQQEANAKPSRGNGDPFAGMGGM